MSIYITKIMQPNEVTKLEYAIPSSQNQHPYFSDVAQINNTYTTNLVYNTQIKPQLKEVAPHPSCRSSNSTSDEGDEQQLSMINERKQRRMISNRESARRSRMRKQRHLDELRSHLIWLINENHHLLDKLNHVVECHDRVLRDNVRLKEEASDLRQMLTHIQPNNYYFALRDLEGVANAKELQK